MSGSEGKRDNGSKNLQIITWEYETENERWKKTEGGTKKTRNIMQKMRTRWKIRETERERKKRTHNGNERKT